MLDLESAIRFHTEEAEIMKLHKKVNEIILGAEAYKRELQEHTQTAEWLRELQETRKERDYWQEKAHSYEQTIFKLTDAISKQPEIIRCGECVHSNKEYSGEMWCGICNGFGIDENSFCSFAERRTDD